MIWFLLILQLLALGLLASALLGLNLIMKNGSTWLHRLAAAVCFLATLAVVGGNWYLVFFVW